MVRDFRESAPAVGPAQRQDGQIGRETRGLALPIAEQARRRDQYAGAVGFFLDVAAQQKRQRLHGLAEAHVVGEHAAETAFEQRAQPAVARALIGPELAAQGGGRRGLGRGGQRAQPPPQGEYLLPALPGNAAALERLGERGRPGRIGLVKAGETVGLEKRGHERRQRLAGYRHARTVGECGIEHRFRQKLLDGEFFAQFARRVEREALENRGDERRGVELAVPGPQVQGDGKPVDAGLLDAGVERHRAVVEAERPTVFHVNRPALAAERGDGLVREIDRRGVGVGSARLYRREHDVGRARLPRRAAAKRGRGGRLAAVNGGVVVEQRGQPALGIAVALDDGRAAVLENPYVAALAGPPRLGRALVGNGEPRARPNERLAAVGREMPGPRIEVRLESRSVERQDGARRGAGYALERQRTRGRNARAARPAQYRPHLRDGRGRDFGRPGKRARQPVGHAGFRRPHRAALRVDIDRRRKRQDGERAVIGVERAQALAARFRRLPFEAQALRAAPADLGAPGVERPRPPGGGGLAQQRPQLRALGPHIPARGDRNGVVGKFRENADVGGGEKGRGRLRGEMPVFLRIGAELSVLFNVNPRGHDFRAAVGVGPEHIEQALGRAGFRKQVAAGLGARRTEALELRPFAHPREPKFHPRRQTVVRVPAASPRRQERRRDMLAIVAHRARALAVNRARQAGGRELDGDGLPVAPDGAARHHTLYRVARPKPRRNDLAVAIIPLASGELRLPEHPPDVERIDHRAPLSAGAAQGRSCDRLGSRARTRSHSPGSMSA